jgi:GNAT superfamily N-acetyltransferase
LETLFHRLAVWDADEAEPHGVARADILRLFHADSPAVEIARYRGPGARLFVARCDGAPAGCVAFDRFAPQVAELHRFFVDPALRGRGAGRALLERAILEAAAAGNTTLLAQTATFMTSAAALYRALGFLPCPPFRPAEPEVAHLEVYLSRPLGDSIHR